MNTNRALHRYNPRIKLITVKPTESPLFSSGKTDPHKIQGLGVSLVPDVLGTDLYDEVVTVSSDETITQVRRAITSERLFVDTSSGVALAAAVEIAKRPETAGKTIVVIIPSFDERCVSTALLEGLVD